MSARPTASTPQLQRQKDFRLPEPILGRPSLRQPSLFLPGEDRELFPPNLSLDERETKRVCLTFDDGPQQGTADVLDVLRDSGVSATFFLTAENMESKQKRQNELVMRMLDEGHKIGNHTFTHDPETRKEYDKAYGDLSNPANLAKFQENYEKNEQYFQTLLGWRFPGFKLARLPGDGRLVKVGGKLILVVATKGMGMAHVSWRFELGTAGSFAHLKVSPWQGIKGVAAEVSGLPRTDDIILLHDRQWAGKQSLLKATLEKLSSSGFRFGKLDDSGTCR